VWPDRYISVSTLVLVLDLCGTFVFALSGAMAGLKHKLDLFGVLVLSFAAANVGGITSDGEVAIGEADNVQTEEVIGGLGNDTIVGSNLADYISGGAGGDNLQGGDGDDQLVGQSGQDNLQGQNNNDYLLAQNNDRDTVDSLYTPWDPQIVNDVHQQGGNVSRIFIPP
jgi:Ca2+-binding RTX toxin-like protein